jgi:POT family proton-dependent oligopeptide transporter
MMGMWFISSFLGNTLSGWIGTFYTTMSKEGFFGLLTVLGIGAGVAMWAFNAPLRNALGEGKGGGSSTQQPAASA